MRVSQWQSVEARKANALPKAASANKLQGSRPSCVAIGPRVKPRRDTPQGLRQLVVCGCAAIRLGDSGEHKFSAPSRSHAAATMDRAVLVQKYAPPRHHFGAVDESPADFLPPPKRLPPCPPDPPLQLAKAPGAFKQNNCQTHANELVSFALGRQHAAQHVVPRICILPQK
jgi:hypothetical protein